MQRSEVGELRHAGNEFPVGQLLGGNQMHVECGAQMCAQGSAQATGEGFVEPADGGHLVGRETAGKAKIKGNDLFYALALRIFFSDLRSFKEQVYFGPIENLRHKGSFELRIIVAL